jgi:menaquinone-dependent protoporphyrinogen oxidase
MHVLIAVASRHGSTQEIADAIAGVLRVAGFTVTCEEINGVASLDGYDAVVLGSAVYMGNWLPEARQFADIHTATLSGMPLWLFSSGPIGPDTPSPEPSKLPELAARLGARDHRVFAGRLVREDLSFAERLITRVVKAPEGDYRDWEAIRAWATDIATALEPVPA